MQGRRHLFPTQIFHPGPDQRILLPYRQEGTCQLHPGYHPDTNIIFRLFIIEHAVDPPPPMLKRETSLDYLSSPNLEWFNDEWLIFSMRMGGGRGPGNLCEDVVDLKTRNQPIKRPT